MLNKEERMAQAQEMTSKLWKKDISNLTNLEITDLIKTMFYQLFLVNVNDISMVLKTGDEGAHYISFEIDGECWRDASGLDKSEIVELGAEIERQIDEE